MKKAIFAAGCFWGVEQEFRQTEGVVSTSVGYIGGHKENPTYEEVCSSTTGHAEAVEIVYNPEIVNYEKLLEVFWEIHNPTQLNRQGFDTGTQYRSAIFYLNEEQKNSAQNSKETLEKSQKFDKPIATQIVPAKEFYRAEEYHQQYFEKRGGGSCKL
ncbi:MAG: peptide-methionine (S)-S-oxide reductase MsrA [bacterium]